MKTTINIYILVCSLAFLSTGCKKHNNSPEPDRSVQILGLDPCTNSVANAPKKGYILYLNATKETVITFNLPQALMQKLSASPKLSDGYTFTPASVETVNLNYHFANKDETVIYICVALYATYSKQVVIDGIAD
ncbi:MAG: hypothetical protein V4592_12560 [Bacteroidota bacterium]